VSDPGLLLAGTWVQGIPVVVLVVSSAGSLVSVEAWASSRQAFSQSLLCLQLSEYSYVLSGVCAAGRPLL
jgi:hypothetical protein